MKIDDFFIPDNAAKLQEELDYARAEEYIRSAEEFSCPTYQSIYIIDYFKRNFLYFSSNPFFLCGLPPEQMMELGYRPYLEHGKTCKQCYASLYHTEDGKAYFKLNPQIRIK